MYIPFNHSENNQINEPQQKDNSAIIWGPKLN